MNLLETIARLFGTSMHLQKAVESAENLINETSVTSCITAHFLKTLILLKKYLQFLTFIYPHIPW